MATWLKLSPREHTAHRSPHEHTSYALLAALLFLVGLALSFYTVTAADLSWERPLPKGGSIGLTGQVPTEPPIRRRNDCDTKGRPTLYGLSNRGFRFMSTEHSSGTIP